MKYPNYPPKDAKKPEPPPSPPNKKPEYVVASKMEVIEINYSDVVDRGRTVLAKWDGEINNMTKQVDALKIQSNEDLATSAEMTGQLKKMIKEVTTAAEGVYLEPYKTYKTILGLKNSITKKLDALVFKLNKKNNDYAWQVELERREQEKKMQEAEAALQKKIAAQAKKKKIELPPAPVTSKLPEKQSLKTESGTMSIKLVMVGEIQDLNSAELFAHVVRMQKEAYQKLAEKTIKGLIKVGITECKGVNFEKRPEAKHRASN
jgi:hypothetical protein